MKTNHWFNLIVAIALAVIVGLTVREAVATAGVISQRTSTNQSECGSLPSRYSIHTEFASETGTRLTYTEDGPTGVDGGLSYLLSAYRDCSR
jgi:hypothetical protein